MDFEAFWNSKNEHFAWAVLKKSNFRSDGYLMLALIDFGSILGGFGIVLEVFIERKSNESGNLDTGKLPH